MRRTADPLALLRYERKHLLEALEASALEARLARTPSCIGEPAGRIVTLYLDREDAALCRRLVDGKGAGSRLRVRWYGEAADPVVIERKHHREGLVRKTRLVVAARELPALLSGADPRARLIGIGRLLYAPLPLCVVAYERHVYRDAGGTYRVTIDRNLSAALPRLDWLARVATGSVPDAIPVPDAPVVVECKHHGEPPRWLETALAPHAAGRFSKLGWAYLRLRQQPTVLRREA